MNTMTLTLKGKTIETISDQVKHYISLTIPEMVIIDNEISKQTTGKFNLLNVIEHLSKKETPSNQALLNKVYNNLSLYKEILEGIAV